MLYKYVMNISFLDFLMKYIKNIINTIYLLTALPKTY